MKQCTILFLAGLLLFTTLMGGSVFAQTKEPVDYTLPYPGIMIDNPLYVLKNFRDKIMELLIADPVKKVEFYILQSDKDWNAGILLDAKGKTALVVQTLTKGNTFSRNAVTIARTLEEQGKPVPQYVIDRLRNSLAKHGEVVSGLMSKPEESQETGLAGVAAGVVALTEDVANLK